MKLSVHLYIAFTTALLIAVAVLSYYNFPFRWVLITTLLGQASLLVMVYKILTDDYTTEKTFNDWYEDTPEEY